MALSRYDRSMMLRACALTCAVALVALLLTAATDEGGLSWGTRVSRTAPALPLASALGAWLALAPLRTRNELVALEALGRPRAWARAAVTLGASAPSLVVAALLARGSVLDAAVFFPRVASERDFRWVSDRFESPLLAVAVSADGDLSRLPGSLGGGSVGAHGGPSAAAAVALALIAVALPLVATAASRPTARALMLALVLVGSLAAFQLVAAQWLTPLAVVVVPLVGFAGAVAELVRSPERAPAAGLGRWPL